MPNLIGSPAPLSPFGGKERKEVQQNFPIRTGETAFLFLQHFIRILKAGGRGGVVNQQTVRTIKQRSPETGILIDRALKDKERGYGDKRIALDADARFHLIDVASGDAKYMQYLKSAR